MTAPRWAQDLALDASLWWEHEGHEPVLPELVWRRADRHQTSAYCCIVQGKERIALTAGRDRTDAKLCLLHEMAHALTHQAHTATFWATAWQLYRRYKVPITYARKREGSYMKGALVAYHRGLGQTEAASRVIHHHHWTQWAKRSAYVEARHCRSCGMRSARPIAR